MKYIDIGIKVKWWYKYEDKFLSDFMLENKNKDWWWYKLRDIWRIHKPFDCLFINKYWLFLCEAKIIKKETLEFSEIRSNQWTALYRIQKLIEKYDLPKIYSTILVFSESRNDYFFIEFKYILELHEKWEKSISFL